jgi:hypothetical protein
MTYQYGLELWPTGISLVPLGPYHDTDEDPQVFCLYLTFYLTFFWLLLYAL